MKDTGLMPYFFHIEVCQSQGEVFLILGNYAIETLKRFQMMDYKLLATLMIPNLKLHVDLDLDLVDHSVYKPLIGYLMYLISTRPNVCFAENTLTQYMVDPRQNH
jgi:hypothetical protein